MDNETRQFLEEIKGSPGASEEAIQSLSAFFEATFGSTTPVDYVEFLRLSNGGVGQGPNLFVVIAGAEDVMQKEKGYGQDDSEKDLFLIGSDGCGNTLGIDTRSKDAECMSYLVFDPIALSSLDDVYAVLVRESSFLRLLASLSDYYMRIYADWVARNWGAMKNALRYLLSITMITAGFLHFAAPEKFVAIVPDWLPAHRVLVAVSGFFEIAGGVGLLVRRVRRAAAWGLVALFIAVFPANVNMAVNKIFIDSPWILWGRLPFQALLVAWAWWFTRPDTQSK